MNAIKRILLAVILVAILLIPGKNVNASNNRIIDGVKIGPVNVSGMTGDEARAAIGNLVTKASSAILDIECVEGNVVALDMTESDIQWTNDEVIDKVLEIGKSGNIITRYKERQDVKREGMQFPIEYSLDRLFISDFIESKCLKFNEEAVNVSLVRTESGFDVVDGVPGEAIELEEATDYLYDFIVNKWDGEATLVTLPVKVDEAKGSEDELSLVKDLLATFSTSYKTSSAARSTNVANGCRLVNGTLLYPGEEFSMYDHIKPFSEANGYMMAGSYQNGLVVDSLGGGICQVSTTLYNAVIRAELEVTERNNHSMIVTYVPASADAAIAESSGKDFRFVNSSDAPVYIEGYVTSDKQIVFNIYGHETRPENRVVTFESKVIETIPAGEENIIASGAYPVGYSSVQSAHTGYKAELYKIVTVDGVEESRELFNKSKYNMVPRTAVIGVATDNPEALAQIQAAIASGSIDQAKAVADAWAAHNLSVAAEQQEEIPVE